MEGRIDKHTLSCGQDIEREKHTHTSTRFFKKGVQRIWNAYRKKTHRCHAVCSAIPGC